MAILKRFQAEEEGQDWIEYTLLHLRTVWRASSNRANEKDELQ